MEKIMRRGRRTHKLLISVAILAATSAWVLHSQTTARIQVRERVDESKLVTLTGNTRPETASGNDLGEVDAALPFDHMTLQLKRSPEQEQELESYLEELQNPASPNFHTWLTAEQYGERFGLAQADIDAVTSWLESHGFKVHGVYPNKTVIDFSGTAGQIKAALHTSIHRLNVNGEAHVANMSDPRIPAALAPAIAGVVGLHDFRPVRHSRLARPRSGTSPDYTFTYSGQTYQALVPADLATIYDFNPLFAKGVTGKGQTIAVVEDTNLYRTGDWTTFRSSLGLSQYTTGSLTTVQPGGAARGCSNPGVNSDDIEAILDAEWASAAAPGAAIQVAACANASTDGLLLAAQNTVNSTTLPNIMSVSYGLCETLMGSTYIASWNNVFQQAVAQGMSVFVSSGDTGPAGCDSSSGVATQGIAVSGFASSPNVVAVGGTDFGDVYAGTTSKYWNASNTASYGSAISYIPEIAWNDSCASVLFSGFNGYSSVYGASGFCSSSYATTNGYTALGGGGGGPSGCATGSPAVLTGVVGGTCKGYAKPSWQKGVTGIPSDGVRDLPDVAMFASDGAQWNHYAVICFSDTTNSGQGCRGAPVNWNGIGGTSLAAPVVAGVMALVNQSTGSNQGNPNPVFYNMAAKVPSAFHPVTQGDNDQPCNGPYNCYGVVGNVVYGRGGRVFKTTYGGALSVSSSSFTPAYTATSNGWNFATGLGSLDVNVLVTNWGIH